MKVRVPAEAEAEGAMVIPTLGRLKTRPGHVSSSSDSIATAPLSSTAARAKLMGWEASAAEDEGVRGVERFAPVAAAFRLARRSAGFFFLSLLKPVPTRSPGVMTRDDVSSKSRRGACSAGHVDKRKRDGSEVSIVADSQKWRAAMYIVGCRRVCMTSTY